MFDRKVFAVQMSYEVPSIEKDRANKAILNFDYLLKLLRNCNDYLDIIYTPFKAQQNIPPEETYKARSALRRFRDKSLEKFDLFKKQAFRCFVMLQPFSADTQIIKLNRSFVMSVSDLEKQVNRMISLFDNIDATDFSTNLTKAIEAVKKEIAELEQIVEDRIKDHIQKDILAKTWVDNVSEELQEKIEKQVPSSVQLVNERNEK